MKIKLYESFEHWYYDGTIYVYSDPHFSDSDQKLMDPLWPSDEEQVKMINMNLGKNDTIIFLGDIGDTSFIQKIKGYKVLIMGNHDKGASNYKKMYTSYLKSDPDNILFESQDVYEVEAFNIEYFINEYTNDMITYKCNDLFDEVYEGPVMINDHILLSHEPVDMGFGINIHGHDHSGTPLAKMLNGSTIQINVCSNIVGYKKQRLDNLVNGLHYVDIHRKTIDNATIRKSKKKCTE
mgnify:CR=1 FL=1